MPHLPKQSAEPVEPVIPRASRIAELASEVAEASTAGDALRKVRELRKELDVFEREQVARALSEGANYSKIARDLGVSRQAVHRRFRSLADGESPLRTSQDVGHVLHLAREEAASLSADAPTGQHILLAALRATDVPAAALLRNAGATLERARTQIEASMPRAPLFQRAPLAGGSDLRGLLAGPAEDARARGDRQIEVEHLLIGILGDEAGGAARTLRALGVDVEVVREGLAKLLRERTG